MSRAAADVEVAGKDAKCVCVCVFSDFLLGVELLQSQPLRCHHLSFHPAPSSNVIMQELKKKKNVKILSEKVLLLLNRAGRSAAFF